MNFGEAIAIIKAGIPVAREGWNGKGMFIYFVQANSYAPTTEVAKARFGGAHVPYRAYIAMKTVDNDVVPWVASQTDILADDWQIAGEISIEKTKPMKLDDLSKMASQEFDRVYKATKPHWTHTPEGKRKLAARKKARK
jgi:hypothetical protein